MYFVVLMSSLPFRVAPFALPLANTLFHYVVTPAVFSAPWLGLLYFERYRIANTVHILRTSTTTVPLRWRVFYGTNAVFVFMFLVLPMIAAPLAIVGGILVAGRVLYVLWLGRSGSTLSASLVSVLAAVALCTLPVVIMLEFIPHYWLVWTGILGAWTGLWVSLVYGISQCLVNALSFVAPVHFIYYGAAQYERGVFGRVYTRAPVHRIHALEALVFLLLVYMYLPPIDTPFGTLPFADMSFLFGSVINWASLAVVVVMTLVKWRLGVRSDSSIGGKSNTAVVAAFLVVEMFFKAQILIISLIIWLAFLVFAVLTIMSYVSASSREMY